MKYIVVSLLRVPRDMRAMSFARLTACTSCRADLHNVDPDEPICPTCGVDQRWPTHCATCRYDLRRHPDLLADCPECGTIRLPQRPDDASDRMIRRTIVQMVTLLVSSAVLIIIIAVIILQIQRAMVTR